MRIHPGERRERIDCHAMMRSASGGSAIDALVADASLRQSLVVLRELGGLGRGVCAVDSRPRVPAFASRWCTASEVLPDVALDREAFVDGLMEVCARHRPRVLIASHDGTIEALRSRRAEVEGVVRLALAPENALAVAVDKVSTLALAEKVGLRAPRGACVADAADAAGALDEVGLPAVIKPSRSWASVGASSGRRLNALLGVSRVEALAAIEACLADGIDVLVQEWLPGDREALSFIYAQGRIWARFAQRADRTSPPLGGYSVARESIPLPSDIASAAEQLVMDMGLEGYSEVEFRRAADGGAALMEINPRLSASVEVAVRAGVPFGRLLYAWAAGEPLEEVGGYRTGVRMRWLEGDMSWLRNALAMQGHPDVPARGRAVRTFVGDFLRPAGYDYLDRRDPRPALVASVETAQRIQRGAKRRFRGATRSAAGLDTEVAVIGAGPYGLSVAAHLGGRGIRHEVFGEPMDTWRNHMPRGMNLKSEGFASNLSDPTGEHTLERFCAEHGLEYGSIGVPVKLDTFERYGDWFRERLVPGLRRVLVDSVRVDAGAFELRLHDGGETLRAQSVIVATGLQGHAYLPPALRELPSEMVMHSYDQRDPALPQGSTVAVLGAGQSAIEGAVLMHEQGADVKLIARRPKLVWNPDPELGTRSLKDRLRHPASGLGNGLSLRLYASHPLTVHALPERRRLDVAYTVLGPAGGWWLRPRFEGNIESLLGRTLTAAAVQGDRLHLSLQGPRGLEELVVSHLLVGTGYRPDLSRLAFLDAGLRGRIATAGGAPVLDRLLQSSVPGLYFVGYPAAVSFGPVMRFVYGADFVARRLARQLG